MNRRSQLAGLGVVLLLVSCSPTSDQQVSAPLQAGPNPLPSVSGVPPAAQGFTHPIVNPGAGPKGRAVPGLLQPTNAKLRVPAIATGRSDPFAQLAVGPLVVTGTQATTARSPRPISQLPARLPRLNSPPLPLTAIGQTPLPAVDVASAPGGALPPLPPGLPTSPRVKIPVAPPSLTALADAIEVTGAVQVQNKWQVIIKEPQSTSRYVTIGDYLANGQVLVKRVVAGLGADPIVILQQNGKEVTKTVGMSKASVASAQ